MPDATSDGIESLLRSHGPFETPPLLRAGGKVGDWRISAFLGRGGSAEVYRAENETTGMAGAIKILYRADGKARIRFKREARLLAEMDGSPFPRFYGAGEDSGRLYIAEELLEPSELPHDDAKVARYVLDVACAVEALHDRGFAHRDVKPANVMMRPSTGEHVLVDMGLLKPTDESPASRNDTLSVVDGRAVGVGTPGFSAPEQFVGGRIGATSDIHALGMLANACFDSNPPKAWIPVIRRSTSSIPEQRYATVAEFTRAIRRRHAVRWRAASIVLASMAVVVSAICAFALRKDAWSPVRDSPSVQPLASDPQPQPEDALLGTIYDSDSGDSGRYGIITSGSAVAIADISGLGETKREKGALVTRIELDGRDVSISGEVKLEEEQKIKIAGPGRLTASITGPESAEVELGARAVLINLTETPYPESKMKFVLKGACYLNFKNLDFPPDGDIKNIWIDDSGAEGVPSFRYRGPDSCEEVRKVDRKAAIESMREWKSPYF